MTDRQDAGPRFRRSPAALYRRAGADVLATTPADPEIHELSGGAVAVWEALTSPLDADELIGRLASEHAVGADRIAEQVRRCLEDLARLGLVEEVRDGDG
jgi:hypothetical protein